MKRTPLKRESRKRQAERDQRTAVRMQALERADHRCQASAYGLVHQCAGPLDCHEIKPRSVYPGAHLDPANIVIVCRAAHDLIGDHPAKAHDLGLHKYSWE